MTDAASTADLFWPGAHRATGLDDAAFVEAMVVVEQSWLDGLVALDVAPADAAGDLTGLVSAEDLAHLSVAAEAGGNPVIGLVALLRERTGGATSRWLHRGLTSQDVVDTALVLLARGATERIAADLRAQLGRLADLAGEHRTSPMVGRTLTQHAVPITIGTKIAGWIGGVADALEDVARVSASLPVQIGGAAGTNAAAVELAGDPQVALDLVARSAEALGLAAVAPWHTTRSPITSIGDALTRCTDAWGRIAADVATLSRPEIAEVREGSGGGSSTMPHKANPVLSVLLKRAALTTPALAATLHLAAATAVDERPDGAWHAEWDTLRLLALRTVVAASQARDLLDGLVVNADRALANLQAAVGVDAEQASMAELAGRAPRADHLGTSTFVVDAAVERARSLAGEA
ncbi:lyase family protein [Aeromicrobium sp. Leaf350]|uniref:lyase family protein n=1 Tax=Aeromicrobium sp. Leaf350 TaxID=2876565 RepID=UPI001E356D43|nr:lyase family protein [Aeromicrobium sp. Leaf350]